MAILNSNQLWGTANGGREIHIVILDNNRSDLLRSKFSNLFFLNRLPVPR